MNHPAPVRGVTTLRAPVRLRSAREHARLARRLRRQQRLTKHAAILAKERAVVVVENLDLRAIRARGGKHKRGVNRTLAEAAPGAFIGVLRRKLTDAGRWLVSVPAPYTSCQCTACGGRNTMLTRARAHCTNCNATHDRDHAAAANILLHGIAVHAAHAQNDSGPSGSAETARQHRLPASECWRAHREPTENIHSARRSELRIVVTLWCYIM